MFTTDVREEEEDIFDRVSGEVQQIFADYQEKTCKPDLSTSFVYSLNIFSMLTETNTSDNLDISITAHSGSLRSVLRALNHPPIALGTGEMVPIVVRVKRA